MQYVDFAVPNSTGNTVTYKTEHNLRQFQYADETNKRTEMFKSILHHTILHTQYGGVVVKALRYKPAGRRFDSRWFRWNFSVT